MESTSPPVFLDECCCCCCCVVWRRHKVGGTLADLEVKFRTPLRSLLQPHDTSTVFERRECGTFFFSLLPLRKAKRKSCDATLDGHYASSLFVHDHKQNLLHDGGVFTLAMKRIRIQKEENISKIMIVSCALLVLEVCFLCQ